MQVVLVEPEAAGRVSGGFLYNHQMAEAAARLRVVSSKSAELSQRLVGLDLQRSDWLLADSLFLNRESLEPFFELRRRVGCRLGLMLHAFPSFVSRAAKSDGVFDAHALPVDEEVALISGLDVVVSPGPYAARVLRRAGATLPVLVCPPGSPAPGSPREPLGESDGTVRLLTVSTVTPGKGLVDAVRALATIPQMRWTWEVIGSLEQDPMYARELVRLVEQLGLAEKVCFAGLRSHAETLTRYAESQVFLLPSHTENYPLVLLEAQACGLPTVGYETGGVPDIVADGDSGLLAPCFDVGAFAARAARLVGDLALRRRLAGRARIASESRPSWSDAACDFERKLALSND